MIDIRVIALQIAEWLDFAEYVALTIVTDGEQNTYQLSYFRIRL